MQSWTIGKNPECDIVIDVPTVSGSHCRLTRQENIFILEDLKSTNGTFVKGQRLSKKVRIRHGTTVMLGQSTPLPWDLVPEPQQNQATQSNKNIKNAAKSTYTIGSESGNDIVFELPMVSRQHARIRFEGTSAEIEDLGSTNGTFVNSRQNRIKKAKISATDAVFFGSYRVPAARLFKKYRSPDLEKSATMHVRSQAVLIGRDKTCGEIIDHPLVSKQHARFGVLGDRMYVEDLDSGNGTFVNGERIHKQTEVSPGDVIQIASFSYRVEGGGELTRAKTQGNLSIEADNISITLGGTHLLDRVSLTICPGEFVGLMGPSGAGKTLLLSALNGYLPPTKGDVLINGENLYANYDVFRGQIGYVPQDDIVHSTLTVHEALYYTARLRLPTDTSDAEINQRIQDILTQLELTGQKNVLIGSAEQRGISGGQRKRVNLAMELITDPSLLILDEPTSGLSSQDTLNVMKLLRGLANQGMTILMTIHQPSLESYQQMDNLILVAKDANAKQPGRLGYYGPAYPDAIQFFRTPDKASQPDVPDLILSGLDAKPAKEWITAYNDSKYRQEFINDRSGNHTSAGSIAQNPDEGPAELWQQTFTLFRRGLAIKLRDKVNTAILLLQAPIIAILIVMVFNDASKDLSDFDPTIAKQHAEMKTVALKIQQAVFFVAIAALWFGCSNSVREIVDEWAIYRRERMVNLKIPCYLASKFAVLGIFCFIQCLCLFTIVTYFCDLATPMLRLLPILFLVAMVGVGIGLTISSIARTSEVALGVLPLVILPMVLLGGLVSPVHDLGAAEPLAHLVPSRWAYEAKLLLEAEYQEEGKTIDPETNKQVPFDIAEAHFPEDDERMGVTAAVLAIIISFILVAAAPGIVLKQRDIH